MPILLLAVAYMMINAKREQDAAARAAAPVPVYVPPAPKLANPKPGEGAAGYLSSCAMGAGVGGAIGAGFAGVGAAIGAGVGCAAGVGVVLYDRYGAD